MSRASTLPSRSQHGKTGRSDDVEAVVRRFGAIHLFAGLLGLVGPAVWGNEDRGRITTDSGYFLGWIAVNGPHALMHVLIGLLGLGASREADSSRLYLLANGAFFGALAAVGWRRFGFERGVHPVGPLAVDGWGNLGHTIISAASLLLGRRE